MKYILLYNDETHIHDMNRMIQSINQYLPDFEVIIFHRNDIDPEFLSNNKEILDCKRGGGYWLWKPYIINEMLKNINQDDILFYLDSKYYFIETPESILEPLSRRDILVWRNKPNEPCYFMKHWCKLKVIVETNIVRDVFELNAEICWAGAIVIRKTNETTDLIKQWLSLCTIPNYIIDTNEKNHTEFREHRHDQSLLSVILIKNNIPLETFPKRYLQNVRCPYNTLNKF
jgi:hypothetical protein